MRIPNVCWAAFVLIPGSASAQEVSTEEIIRQIQRSVGSQARPAQPGSGKSRTFSLENGVDAGRRPQRVAPAQATPPAATQAAPPEASAATAPSDASACNLAVSFNQILFERGSARISGDPQTRKTIDALVGALVAPGISSLRFLVRGHTDSTGSFQTNLRLSQQRAEAVALRLIAGGVQPERLQPRGLASAILADPANPASFRNRRVDICTLAVS